MVKVHDPFGDIGLEDKIMLGKAYYLTSNAELERFLRGDLQAEEVFADLHIKHFVDHSSKLKSTALDQACRAMTDLMKTMPRVSFPNIPVHVDYEGAGFDLGIINETLLNYSIKDSELALTFRTNKLPPVKPSCVIDGSHDLSGPAPTSGVPELESTTDEAIRGRYVVVSSVRPDLDEVETLGKSLPSADETRLKLLATGLGKDTCPGKQKDLFTSGSSPYCGASITYG